MHKYGRQAMRAWQENLPEEYSQIEDPEKFFTDLGEQIFQEVMQIEDSILRAEGLSTDYLMNVGQRNMARLTAEEKAMHDLVWSRMPAAEETESTPASPTRTRLVDSAGMPMDPNHPLWTMRRDETVTDQQFEQALDAWWAELEAMGQV